MTDKYSKCSADLELMENFIIRNFRKHRGVGPSKLYRKLLVFFSVPISAEVLKTDSGFHTHIIEPLWRQIMSGVLDLWEEKLMLLMAVRCYQCSRFSQKFLQILLIATWTFTVLQQEVSTLTELYFAMILLIVGAPGVWDGECTVSFKLCDGVLGATTTR